MALRQYAELAAIAVIFVGFTIALLIIGAVNAGRTEGQTELFTKRVQNSHGGPLIINPPTIYYEVIKESKTKVAGFETISSYKERETVDPSGSGVEIDLTLERKKIGNLWFSVFLAKYQGRYRYDLESIPEDYHAEPLFLVPGLNSSESIFRNIELKINDVTVQPLSRLVSNTPIELTSKLGSGGKMTVDIYYETTGTEYLLYELSNQDMNRSSEDIEKTINGQEKQRLKRLDDFNLTLTTDFIQYDFPKRTIPYTGSLQTGERTELEWHLDKTVTGKNIGLIVPDEINPGEIASRISFFAPVSLLFFFVVLTVFGILSGSKLHPMQYFFVAATFLSFHLTFSYAADHISMYFSFGIASLVSCFLTFSYLVRVKDRKFALIATLLQLLYLVVFSWSFFYQTESGLGITGLIVTIVSVLTLFALMQFTAQLDWKKVDLSTEGVGSSLEVEDDPLR